MIQPGWQFGPFGTQAIAGAVCAGDAVTVTAIPVDPAIAPAATRAISAGLAARDFSRAVRVCRVGAADWFWLIGLFLPAIWPVSWLSACLVARRWSVTWPTRLASAC